MGLFRYHGPSSSERFRAGARNAKFALAAGALLVAGCGGPPQVGADNLRLVDSLRTAISARRGDWLEENAQRVAERHEAGQMDDKQFAAFEAIIAQARAGEWPQAEVAVVDLAKAQRPAPAK